MTDQDASTQTTANGPQSNDAFSVESLRLSQDFAATIGVKKLLTTVPVRKPNRQEFIRVHSEDSYRLATAVLEMKEDRETYIVAPDLWPELPTEITPKLLATTINRQGVVFLWPIRLPGADGRIDHWNESAMEAAQRAHEAWVRVAANMSLGAYELFQATAELEEPKWPHVSFQELLDSAFRGRRIESLDHPVIRRLQGLA